MILRRVTGNKEGLAISETAERLADLGLNEGRDGKAGRDGGWGAVFTETQLSLLA